MKVASRKLRGFSGVGKTADNSKCVGKTADSQFLFWKSLAGLGLDVLLGTAPKSPESFGAAPSAVSEALHAPDKSATRNTFDRNPL